MFRSYWDKQSKSIAAGFCLLAIFGLALLAYSIGSHLAVQGERDYERARNAQSEAQRHILESCLKLDGGSAIKCATNEIYASAEKAKSDKDLNAQENMVAWAAVAGILGILQLTVSSFGLFALLRTIQQTELALKEAKRANDISANTRDILERPYLGIVAIKPPPKPEPFDCSKDLTYTISNFGRSHAIVTHVAVVIEMVWKEGDDRFLDPENVQGRAIGRGLVVPPGSESEPFQVTLKKDKGDEIHNLTSQGGYMHGFVRYEDAFGKRHVTGFTLLYTENSRSFHILVTHNKNANYSRSDEAAVRLAEPRGETES